MMTIKVTSYDDVVEGAVAAIVAVGHLYRATMMSGPREVDTEIECFNATWRMKDGFHFREGKVFLKANGKATASKVHSTFHYDVETCD